MNTLTRNYLRSKFREYYLQAALDTPPGLESREWGFILFDEIGMRRHKSYLGRGELVDYIRSMVPAHLYHSAAYYQRPGAPTMKEKGWQGADLIFDLDADHLRKAPKSYSDMLDLVKKETLKLLNFLLADFGFSEKNISVVFSGGRGYHIHVRDPKVLALGSDERREIVDYLTGRGLDAKRLKFKVVVSGDVGNDRVLALRCPREDAAGWGSKFNQAISLFAEEIRSLDKITATNKLMKIKGIGKVRATDFYQNIKNDRVMDDIRVGNLDSLKGIQDVWNFIIDNYLADQFVQVLGGETDEPVTADIRRLIRCPTSLHGGSGFRVTPLTIQSMEEFEPLWDAVVFGDEPVLIDVVKPFKTEIRGESYDLGEGRSELPACAAIFLMARGAADLGKALEG
ncbi:DNA primase small subunit PriS [uncultured archaeon]|nr:DNA primase small subunit PriS [uncultured archaeon]